MAEPTILTHTASDGYVWKYRQYNAAQPRAHVVAIHGIQSHGGWYENSCRRLCDAGFTVSFLDRRGAGLNEQDRGDTPSFRRLIDDVAEFLADQKTPNTKHQTPNTKHFLMAISWGGKIATALLKRHPGLVDGMALLCPGIFAAVGPSLRERLKIAGCYLLAPRRLFPIPLNDPALFTASPQWQDFVRNDPLSLRQATARFLANSVRLDFYLRRVPPHVTIPVMLLLAGQERIVNNARTRRFVESFASTDRTVLEYPVAQHTLEFEPQPHRYLDDLLDWLNRVS